MIPGFVRRMIFIKGWIVTSLILCGSLTVALAQSYLKAGFNGPEYLEVLRIAGYINDTSLAKDEPPAPLNYVHVYQSPVAGLDNQWDLWVRKDEKVGLISLRGTTQKLDSWLENFYAASVPAEGQLRINDSITFIYKLAESKAAAVHVGWLVGIAHMAPSIAEHIREYRKKGIREFIVAGHSQGGALSFLLRSWLYYEQQAGRIPADVHFKTYSSAAPKPGNMYYVYDYDFITRNGWAFNVVNSLDWVPETPFSIQSLQDFNEANPFTNVKPALKKQKMLVRWYLSHAYHSLDRTTRKSQKRFRKYLGKTVYSQVKKFLPQLKEPMYAAGSNYMRAGSPVVLMPDELYNKEYVFDGKNVFIHHMPLAYYKLAKRLYGQVKP